MPGLLAHALVAIQGMGATYPRAFVEGRRLMLLCGIVPTMIAAVLTIYRPPFLVRLDHAAYDSAVRWAGSGAAGERVVIVDIDERSVSAIGQWPWRRDLIGRLIARLHDLGATTIALDVMLPERDRFEALPEAAWDRHRNAHAMSSEPTSTDAALAETLSRGHVVLGYALTFGESGSRSGGCVLHPLGLALVRRDEGTQSPFFRASGAICSLPVLTQAATVSGFLNAAPDADGILRRVPLLVDLDGRVYPGLALAAVLAATGTRDVTVRVANANSVSMLLDNRNASLDGKSNLLLRYRGKTRTFRYVSAADVIGGQLPSDSFRNKMVFIGVTALGTNDVVATPFDTQFPGVEVQATVADNLLTHDFIWRSEHTATLEILAVLFVGASLAWLAGRAGLAWGSLGVVMWLAVLWSGSVWRLATAGEFLSPLFPTVGLLAVLAAMTVAKVSAEHRRADLEGEEKATSRRLMVQALLSLTEARDVETGRHARRTQRYAKLLAEQLAAHPRFHDYLTPERIDLLASLAPLHDIGKVAIPDRLLNKAGTLTGDELEEMRKHPVYGRDVILQAEQRVGNRTDPILAMAKDIVYTHHEWWDGTGYPEGLIDEQIPIAGRLVALVDMYDALVTQRVYRPPIPHDRAVALILEGRGTHFDPAVVDAFLQIVPALGTAPEEAEC